MALNCKTVANSCPDDRLRELSRKNEEYSQMIQRLLNTVETEREIYEKRIRDMTRESEEHIRRLANKCRDQKLQLINRNLEIEREMKRLLDMKGTSSSTNNSAKQLEDLQERLDKALLQLDCKSKVLKEVEEERTDLRQINKRLEIKVKEIQIRTNSYKTLLEQEVTELQTKLKSSEKKNVELLSDCCSKEVENSRKFNNSTKIVTDYDKCVAEGLGEKYRQNRSKSYVSGRSRKCRSQVCAAGTSSSFDTETYENQDKSLSSSFDSGSCFKRTVSKEICCLLVSVTVFAITFFLKAVGTDSGGGCSYLKKPYEG